MSILDLQNQYKYLLYDYYLHTIRMQYVYKNNVMVSIRKSQFEENEIKFNKKTINNNKQKET